MTVAVELFVEDSRTSTQADGFPQANNPPERASIKVLYKIFLGVRERESIVKGGLPVEYN